MCEDGYLKQNNNYNIYCVTECDKGIWDFFNFCKVLIYLIYFFKK